jgi:hypothetical protein
MRAIDDYATQIEPKKKYQLDEFYSVEIEYNRPRYFQSAPEERESYRVTLFDKKQEIDFFSLYLTTDTGNYPHKNSFGGGSGVFQVPQYTNGDVFKIRYLFSKWKKAIKVHLDENMLDSSDTQEYLKELKKTCKKVYNGGKPLPYPATSIEDGMNEAVRSAYIPWFPHKRFFADVAKII